MNSRKLIYKVQNNALYDTDVQRIEGNAWITDSILRYAGTIIELAANESCESHHKNVLLFPGSMLHLVRTAIRSITDNLLKFWNFFDARYVLLPFNNSTEPMQSGSHWSLIIWDTNYSPLQTSKFYYYDSINGSAKILAYEAAEFLCKYYEIPNFEFIVKESPQQENGYDCGMFVLAFMEQFSKSLNFDDITKNVNQKYVSTLRQEFVQRYKP